MSEKIVQINEEIIKGQIKELVRGSVEETLNELLEQEAEKLTQAARYERNEARQGYRSGHYDRNLTTTSGDVTLHVPRLKGISFETAIIERYRRRESSVEEALIEMYLAGVSVRRVEDITEALWGSTGKSRQNRKRPACRNLRQRNHPRSSGTKDHLPPERHRKQKKATRLVIFIRSSGTKSTLPRLLRRGKTLPNMRLKRHLPLPSGSARRSSISFSPISGRCMRLLRLFWPCSCCCLCCTPAPHWQEEPFLPSP